VSIENVRSRNVLKKLHRRSVRHRFSGCHGRALLPFYFEWARHAFLFEGLGIDIEQLFEQGQQYVVLEYHLKFRKSLHRDDEITVSCELVAHEKSNRVNVVETMVHDGAVCAEGTFVCTCLDKGRPTIPAVIRDLLNSK